MLISRFDDGSAQYCCSLAQLLPGQPYTWLPLVEEDGGMSPPTGLVVQLLREVRNDRRDDLYECGQDLHLSEILDLLLTLFKVKMTAHRRDPSI